MKTRRTTASKAPRRRPVSPPRSALRYNPGKKAAKVEFDTDELAKMFGLTEWQTLRDFNEDYLWRERAEAEKEARRARRSESAVEKAGEKAEQDAEYELFRSWHRGVTTVAETYFGKHHLTLVPVSTRRRNALPYKYRVEATDGWRKALREIIETINGVGMFYFKDAADIIRSGPYKSDRDAVVNHIHWIARWPEVYGETSAESIYKRAFR